MAETGGNYIEGATVRLSALFEAWDDITEDYIATFPTTATLKIKDPAGNRTSYDYSNGAPSNDLSEGATGVLYISIVLDTPGSWKVYWIGTGAAAGVGQYVLNVKADIVGEDIV